MPFPPEVMELREKVRNWGRWGADDEIGTLNLITDDVVKAAATEVRAGKRFSLALPLDANGPQIGYTPGRENPVLEMVAINSPYPPDDLDGFVASDDKVTTSLQAATHWDALSHVSSGGKMYNGVPADAVTAAGTTKLGIEKVTTLVGRGVLLDIARSKSQDALTEAYAITGDDLDAACEFAKVKVQPGDIVLLRTGKITEFLAGDKVAYCGSGCPGPSLQSVQWLRDHDVAALATDNYQFEVYPSEREDAVLPIHILHLVDMGMTQGQNWNLEALAADCADDGRYTVFLSATPEPFTHAVSGLVHPVAVK